MKSIIVPKLDLKGKTFEVVVPSSKSIANRALILAALSKGTTRLRGDFAAEDIQLMVGALEQLGIRIQMKNKASKGFLRFALSTGLQSEWKKGGSDVRGADQKRGMELGKEQELVIKNDLSWMDDERNLKLNLGNSGTCVRFLTSLVLFRKGSTVLTGKERMKERPIKDLVDALRQLGAEIEYLDKEGFPPVRVKGLSSLATTQIRVKGNISSQFLSSILLVAWAFEGGLKVQIEGELISKPYVEMTEKMLEDWRGLKVNQLGDSFASLRCARNDSVYEVEGDASAATYWWALEHLHDCVINVQNVQNDSIQGDVQFKKVLHKLSKSRGLFDVNMNDMPDAAMTLMAVAPFHKYPVTIRGIGSLRVKETDRIEAMCRELAKVGVKVKSGKDWVKIWPLLQGDSFASLRSAQNDRIETYDDHRIAMSMAVLGTRLGGLEIEHPECVNKTYPGFWRELERLS